MKWSLRRALAPRWLAPRVSVLAAFTAVFLGGCCPVAVNEDEGGSGTSGVGGTGTSSGPSSSSAGSSGTSTGGSANACLEGGGGGYSLCQVFSSCLAGSSYRLADAGDICIATVCPPCPVYDGVALASLCSCANGAPLFLDCLLDAGAHSLSASCAQAVASLAIDVLDGGTNP